jgi:hypothetical protein
MEETAGDSGPSEADASHYRWLPPNLVEKMQAIDLCSQDESFGVGVPGCSEEDVSPQAASQMLWETGILSCRIPNGFYSVIPVCTFGFLSLLLRLRGLKLFYVVFLTLCG